MNRNVIIACDFAGSGETLAFLKRFGAERPFVKIGMELFYAAGPDIVRSLKERGHPVFLDLKLHDIPNTVAGAVRSLRSLGVDMMNLHAAGGTAMMKAAADMLLDTPGKAPTLIAVTILTSLGEKALQQELLIQAGLEETVLQYARNAKDAGLSGVVCSPMEAGLVHDRLGADFLTVTPGVRFLGGEAGDQQRVTTPAMAREIGADCIVVGRPITRAQDPLQAYRRCMDEFAHC